MALRIPWDKYETALLIETYLQIESGTTSRTDAIRVLSEKLRKRAVENGVEIDDIYRNENGISIQLGYIQKLMRHRPDAHKHNTKIFVEMVKLYDTNRAKFNAILAEAKGEMVPVKTNQDLFFEWIADKVPSSKLTEYYFAASEIETLARKKKIINGSLWQVTQTSITKKIIEALNRDSFFRFVHRKQIKYITDLIAFYHDYTKENEIQFHQSNIDNKQNHRIAKNLNSTSINDQGPQNTNNHRENEKKEITIAKAEIKENQPLESRRQSENNDDALNQTNDIPTDESKTEIEKKQTEGITTYHIIDLEQTNPNPRLRPVALSYFGDERAVITWKDAYIIACKLLYEDYPDVFNKLKFKNTSQSEYLVYSSGVEEEKISNEVFIRIQPSASAVIMNLRQLCEACNVDNENLMIKCVEEKEEDPPDSEATIITLLQDANRIESRSEQDNNCNSPSRNKSTHSNKKQFEKWLIYKKGLESSARQIADYIDEVSDLLFQNSLIDHTIFSISDHREVDKIYDKLLYDEKYVSVSSSVKGFYQYIDSWNLLSEFYREKVTSYNTSDVESHKNLSSSNSDHKECVQINNSSIISNETSPKESLVSRSSALGDDDKSTSIEDTQHINYFPDDKKEKFVKWLVSHKKLSTSLANSHALSIVSTGQYLVRNRFIFTSLPEISDVVVLNNLYEMLRGDSDYATNTRSSRGVYQDLYAFQCFIEFTKDGKIKKPSLRTRTTQNKTKRTNTKFFTLDFTKSGYYQDTVPLSLSYFDFRFSVSTWRQVYIKLIDALCDDYSEKLLDLCNDYVQGAQTQLLRIVRGTAQKNQLISPQEVGNGFFIETKRNPNEFISSIKAFLDFCSVDYDEVIIQYRIVDVRSCDISSISDDTSKPHTTVSRESHSLQQKSHSDNTVTGVPSPDLSVVHRSEFNNWLRQRGFAASTSNSYSSTMSSLDKFAVGEGLIDHAILEISNFTLLEATWDLLQASKSFADFDRKQNRRFTNVMKQYLSFARRNLSKETEVLHQINQSETISQPKALTGSQREQTPIKKSESTQAPSVVSRPLERTKQGKAITQKHPGRQEFETWLKETGCPGGTIQTYTDSVERISSFLLEHGLEDRPLFSIRGVARLQSIRVALRNNQEFSEQSKTNRGVHLELYALKKYIDFRTGDADDQTDDVLSDQLSKLLQECFSNGFRLNSIIDRNRLKQFYEGRFGTAIELDDQQILDRIKTIGTVQDNRVFYHEGSDHSDLIDDIQAELAFTFNQGASCIYYTELFQRHQDALAAQVQVYNPDTLKNLLVESSYGEYLPGRFYFYRKSRSADADSDIRAAMRASTLPLTYEQLQERLWYLPQDRIKRCLLQSSDLVNVDKNTYFDARNLPVNDQELLQITRLIHRQLAQKDFLTDAELRDIIRRDCPSVAINTEDFTTWGLRNCLAVLLSGQFSFNGPIVSEIGRELNMGQAFAQFSQSHELMTLDELKQFAKEVNKSIIYWDSVMEVMVRISQDEFIPKTSIEFDVDAIDHVLDELFEGEYAPLKSLDLFFQYPAISVKWNSFVLESYIAGFSRKFDLLHSSYTMSECCGAVVRKESNIKDFQALVTDVLVHDGQWHSKNDALTLLVREGYLQRKNYAKIDTILPEAKLLREKNATGM